MRQIVGCGGTVSVHGLAEGLASEHGGVRKDVQRRCAGFVCIQLPWRQHVPAHAKVFNSLLSCSLGQDSIAVLAPRMCSSTAMVDELNRQSQGLCDRVCCGLAPGLCLCACMRAVCWLAIDLNQGIVSLITTGGAMLASMACLTTSCRSLPQAPS